MDTQNIVTNRALRAENGELLPGSLYHPRKKIDVQMACETSSVMAAARLVDLGVGCAFLDPFVARTLNNPTVGIRKLSPHITHSYSILAPSNASISEEARKFLKCLNDVANVLK